MSFHETCLNVLVEWLAVVLHIVEVSLKARYPHKTMNK